MTRKTYLIASFATLAAFALAIVRPEFVIDLVARLEPEPAVRARPMVIRPAAEPVAAAPEETAPTTPPAADTVDVAGINFDLSPEIVQAAEAEDSAPAPATDTGVNSSLTANRLVIPRMKVDSNVIFANTDAALRKGLWHIPGSAVPGQNGNIVISAHRWLHKYPHPASFYSIDTLQVGDPIYYDYQGSRYEYRVIKTFVVDPDQVEILSQDENKLTLFTCTPLYSTKQRLVVNAELVSVTPL